MRTGGEVRWIGVVALAALGACSSEMDPNAGKVSGTTVTTPSFDSLSALTSVADSKSLMLLGTNGGALAGALDGSMHFYDQDPGTIAAAAFAAHISVCSIELDGLIMPPRSNSDLAASLAAGIAKCNQEASPDMLAKLGQLQTPTTVVIVGANAAETWHTTNNGVNDFYGDQILGMLHAARTLNVSACVVAPADLSLPMSPTGQTPGLSIADALTGCGLPQ